MTWLVCPIDWHASSPRRLAIDSQARYAIVKTQRCGRKEMTENWLTVFILISPASLTKSIRKAHVTGSRGSTRWMDTV